MNGLWKIGPLLLWAAWLAAGCDGAGIDTPRGAAPGSAITPRASWRAAGDLRDAPRAIDGDRRTAAVSGESYAGAALTIDLGKPCVFNRVAVDHGPDEFGFPRWMSVSTSLDGQQFTLQAQVPGKRKVTNALLIRPILARYVRLQAVAQGARPWWVAEVFLQ